MSAAQALLDVANLSVSFDTGTGIVRAASGVSFTLEAGQTLCLVGESGSGKSVTALAIMALHGKGAAVTADRLALSGESLAAASPARLAAIRGHEISMIFQNPMSSLNPAFTIGFQITEAICLHEAITKKAARKRALEMLQHVRIPDAGRHLDSYPHEMSGGMRQRAMIAMALACRPKVLIADEPTTALDVTVQAQILDLIDGLRREFSTAVLLITHDLGVVAEMADDVAVMYAGRIVEKGLVKDIFDSPAHPYTAGLLAAIPTHRGRKQERLTEIPGNVPRLDEAIRGCAFVPRCAYAGALCSEDIPDLKAVGPTQKTACLRHGSIALGRPDHLPRNLEDAHA